MRERAEAAVTKVLAEGSAEECSALATRLRVAADAYTAGQRPGSPALALATHLRALAERLELPGDADGV